MEGADRDEETQQVPKTAQSTTPPTQMKNSQLSLAAMVSNQCKLTFLMTCPKVSVGLYGP